MLRASCSILIKAISEAGKMNENKTELSLKFIAEEENHEKIRNLIAMVLLPKKLHRNDSSRAAYLRAAVSRVSEQRKNVEIF